VYNPTLIVTSVEPKAAETGLIVARRLGLSVEAMDGLHEHARSGVGWLGTGDFQRAIAAFFAFPDRLVFGDETAHQARERFTQAIQSTLARHMDGNVAVVAHGTVISLFAAAHAGKDGYFIWQRLGLPAYVVLALPDFTLIELVERLS